jgi:hypothetical protein
MEMWIFMMGLGIAIPKTDIGLDLLSGCYVQVRATHSAVPLTYVIGTYANPGGKTGTVALGHIITEWFAITPSKYSWLFNPKGMLGSPAELNVSGTLIIKGQVDINFKLLDNEGNVLKEVKRINVKATGGQLSSTYIYGTLMMIPPKASQLRKAS